MSIFERFASAFTLSSDEDVRWEREGGLILKLARESGAGKQRVLDLACGNGFHARHLALAGCHVTALDISKATLQTGRGLRGGKDVRWRVGDIAEPFKGTYDLILLVGNTLSLIREVETVRRLMVNVSSALCDEGILLLHAIDYGYLRAHPVHFQRRGEIEGSVVTFDKRIDPHDGGALITIRVKEESDAGTQSETRTEVLHEWSSQVVASEAGRAGFVLRSEYGGLDASPREPGRSKDAVFVFRKDRSK